MEKAQHFFENYIGEPSTSFVQLPQSGSSRKNFIAKSSEKTFVVTQNKDIRENESFIYFSRIFKELHLNTPQIFSISEDRTIYIQEFLGNETLSQIIAKAKSEQETKPLVEKSLKALFQLQKTTENKIDFSKAFDYEKYDELPILHDLYYFKNFLVDVLEIEYHKSTLLKEFKKIVSLIEDLAPKGMMIRDFQSRNIMVSETQNVAFIDYQSAMQGPLMYDVVSFLYQAKANFSEDFKNEMLNFYFDLWEDETTISKLKTALQPIQLIRYLQVLGAYGFRGLIQRKSHFTESLNQGIKNINQLSETWQELNQFPELNQIIKKLHSNEINSRIKKIINNENKC